MRKKSKILLGGIFGCLVILILISPILQPETATHDAAAQHYPSSAEELYATTVSEGPPQIERDGLSLTEIFERVEGGVVSITAQKSTSFGRSDGVGSGFIYDDSGYIITNNHVVEGSNKITITLIDGMSYNGKVIGMDALSDLAVVKINTEGKKLIPLPLGNSSNIKVGNAVVAIGNPFGLSGSMTSGIISQIGRLLPSQETGFTIPDVIQTDAAINPGNSGGPLLNMQGEVIGINTAIYSNGGDFAGIGFAIPSDTITKIIPHLIKDGQYKHPWIGITSINVTPDLSKILKVKEARGIQIMTVVKDSPAYKAGLRGSSETLVVEGIHYTIGGDIVLGIDGNQVRKIDDILIYLQREKNVGDMIELKILRDGKLINSKITLEERPNQN